VIVIFDKHTSLLQLKCKVAGDKGISETKSKQQRPCSNCMHRPVTSGAMHAVHACISLWGACISLWHHRL